MFEPFFLLRNGHLQTIASKFWAGDTAFISHHQETKKVKTPDGDTLLIHSHKLLPAETPRDTILLVHGFEGSAESVYMKRLTAKALRRGFNVYRMNLRGCGESLSLSRRAYHAGLWSDVKAVIASLEGVERLFLIGISLGGNTILKMAGELEKEMQTLVCGLATLSPPLDLMNCTTWIDRTIYRNYFLKSLHRTYEQRMSLFPEVYGGLFKQRPKTIFEFDNYVTAAIHHFKDAEDYYSRNSCGPVLGAIKVPSLVIYSRDDPIVPFYNYDHYQKILNQHQYISFLCTDYGGHTAFISNVVQPGDTDRFWADERIFSFFKGL